MPKPSAYSMLRNAYAKAAAARVVENAAHPQGGAVSETVKTGSACP
jgi:hypothetical protein